MTQRTKLEDRYDIESLLEWVHACKNPNDANDLCKRLGIYKSLLERFCKRNNIDFSPLAGPSITTTPTAERNNQFIERAKKVHGDRYDYTNTQHGKPREKLEVICRSHGSFWVTPHNHLAGSGCAKCAHENNNSTTEEFVSRAREIHGDKYDYSRVKYNKALKKVTIICPDHGEFKQTPASHLNNNGCPECGVLKRSETQKVNALEKFLSLAKDGYVYSNFKYDGAHTKSTIICLTHGAFEQSFGDHFHNDVGCPKCGIHSTAEKLRSNSYEFTLKSRDVHGDKYDYSLVDYVNNSTKVDIICPVHGRFDQIPNAHLRGIGCPRCVEVTSRPQREIIEFIKSIYSGEIVSNDTTIINPKHLDVFIPDLKFAIEYNGNRWHSTQFRPDRYYHYNKYKAAADSGVHLISIFSDQWFLQKDIVKSIIANKLGATPIKIFARKCEFRMISSKEANTFYQDNHIQGKTNRNKYNAGLFYNNELVAAMTFGLHPRSSKMTLSRYATKLYTNVVGGASKLFKHLTLEASDISTLVSWSDNCWSNGDLYKQLGFDFERELRISYYYTNGSDNTPRLPMQAAQKSKIGCPPDMPENVFMLQNFNMWQIWDCGKKVWKWKREK